MSLNTSPFNSPTDMMQYGIRSLEPLSAESAAWTSQCNVRKSQSLHKFKSLTFMLDMERLIILYS